jgi:predicted glutamine amidotransferase
MCGIAGWILEEKPSEAFVLALMIHMEDRGRQSYGLYNGNTDTIIRNTGMITSHARASEIDFTEGFIHTRHATTGCITPENSHPYRIADIVGAHNGMIYNHAEMNLKYDRKCSVDSMHIFEHIAAKMDTVELEGYGAIEYKQNGKYFIARSHGELCVAKLKNGIVWASTSEALDAAIFQSGYELEHFYQIDSGTIYLVELDGLYKTDMEFHLTDKKPITGKTDWRQFSMQNIRSDKKSDLDSDYQGAWKGFDQWDDTPEGSDTLSSAITFSECTWCGEYGDVQHQKDGSCACIVCLRELEGIEQELEGIEVEEFDDGLGMRESNLYKADKNERIN